MRSELGQVFRSRDLAGQVTARSETSVFVEIRDLGFATIVTGCEGEFDCVITLAVPTRVVNRNTLDDLRQSVIQSFDLDPTARYLVKICQPFQLTHEPYLAEPASPFASGNSWGISWSNFASRPGEQLYSVPRRYDLASMFAISVAYAVLFAILRALSAPALLSLVAGIFVAVIGAAQAILFGGNKPRESSIIAGGVTGFAAVIVISLIGGMRPQNAIPSAVCSIFWGPVAGYLAGTMVGGIWLTADYLRKWFEPDREAPAPTPAASTTTKNDYVEQIE